MSEEPENDQPEAGAENTPVCEWSEPPAGQVEATERPGPSEATERPGPSEATEQSWPTDATRLIVRVGATPSEPQSSADATPAVTGTVGSGDIAYYGQIEPWYRTVSRYPAQVGILGAIVVLALIVGMVFAFGSSGSPEGKPLSQAAVTSTFPTTTVPHRSTTTVPQHPTAAASGSATTTTTAANPETVVAAAPTTTAPPGPCTTSDLTITTTTDAASYVPGAPVTATTRLVDETACVFTPVPSGEYHCPTTIDFVDSNGDQVYPVSGQGEQCADVTGGTLSPGATRSVAVQWPEQAAGQYKAVGTWSWSAVSGPAVQAGADSSTFSVS